jgi:hypothetical protein
VTKHLWDTIVYGAKGRWKYIMPDTRESDALTVDIEP